MRLLPTAFLLCLFAGPALAEDCGVWSASMQEDEGGPVMTASVCAKASTPDMRHDFFMQCGTKDSLWIRYIPFTDNSYPPGGNEEYKSRMTISAGTEKATLDAHFESMDGAMVMETEVKSNLIAAMTSGKDFTVTDTADTKLPPVTFSLSHSKAALEKLIKTCGQ